MNRENSLKVKLGRDEAVIGTFAKSSDPAVMENLGLGGFDFVIIDNEHTLLNGETTVNLIRAAELAGMVPTVRVRENHAADILQALDAGALGVQVPNVDTAEQAGQVVERVKYAPEGKRGFAASQRSAGYGSMDPAEYAAWSNANTLVACYCETKAGLDHLDDILRVDGLDIVFVGPFDLSQALGVIGRVDHPSVREALETVVGKTRAAGKTAGTIAGSAEQAAALIGMGYRYICLGSDLSFVASAGKRMVGELRTAGR